MQFLAMKPAGDAASAATRTLIEQTGRADLGMNVDRWQAWWKEQEWIPEADWLRRITQSQADRARASTARAVAAERRETELFRDLYAATSREERPALLSRLLRHSVGDIRRLGIDLASRAILNATKVPPDVIETAAGLLMDPSADIRAAAAKLLAASGLGEQAPVISKALATETSPQAASAMLDAIAFTTLSRGDIESVLRWISDPEAGPAAVKTLVVANDQGLLIRPAPRNFAWATVSEDIGVSLGPGGVRLFGRLAPASDFNRLSELLSSSDAAIREAAAESLSLRPDGVEPLLTASEGTPSLLPFALDALIRHRPTAAGWIALSSISAISEAPLQTMARSLPPSEALAAAKREQTAARRLLLLERFAPAPANGGPAIDSRDARPPSIQRSGWILRLSALLDDGQYNAVIADAGAPKSWMTPDERRRITGVALLCLARVDEAVAFEAGPEEWLDAASRLAGRDEIRLRTLLDAAPANIGDKLTEDQRRRLLELRAMAGITPPETADAVESTRENKGDEVRPSGDEGRSL